MIAVYYVAGCDGVACDNGECTKSKLDLPNNAQMEVMKQTVRGKKLTLCT